MIENDDQYHAALARLAASEGYDPEAVMIAEEVDEYERGRIWLPGEGVE